MLQGTAMLSSQSRKSTRSSAEQWKRTMSSSITGQQQRRFYIRQVQSPPYIRGTQIVSHKFRPLQCSHLIQKGEVIINPFTFLRTSTFLCTGRVGDFFRRIGWRVRIRHISPPISPQQLVFILYVYTRRKWKFIPVCWR